MFTPNSLRRRNWHTTSDWQAGWAYQINVDDASVATQQAFTTLNFGLTARDPHAKHAPGAFALNRLARPVKTSQTPLTDHIFQGPHLKVTL